MSMEYVQTVLVQIEAAKIDEASRPLGLLAELDEHRNFLQQQPGFQDMRVTRSINSEGNVLLVVETRWRDDDSLVEYETREPNVMSIVNKHQDLIVPDSLQVLDMEALRTEAWRGPAPAAAEARERIALPLLVPAGVLAFALLVIYGLSRIYLDVPKEVATPLAAGIALGILSVSWYLASHPSVPGWQIASIVTVAAALLLGGGIFAAVHEEGAETAPAAATEPGASPTAAASPGPGGAALSISMIPTIKFDKTTLTIAANREVTIEADNRDTGILHNFAVYTDDSAKELKVKTKICTAPCKETVTLNLAASEYFFRCDVHPQQMTGKLIVQ